jgi:hypothetical protein
MQVNGKTAGISWVAAGHARVATAAAASVPAAGIPPFPWWAKPWAHIGSNYIADLIGFSPASDHNNTNRRQWPLPNAQ